MPVTPALASGTRAPIPFADERGISCLRVPLDDEGREYAAVELTDYKHITETLGCLASWYMNPNGSGLRYVSVNVPATEGSSEGLVTVVRLLPGVGRYRAGFVNRDTKDLRRTNVRIATGGKGSLRDCGKLMAEAVERQQAAKQSQEGIKDVR